ncbi:MAG: hypothetical protein AMXMBFR33_62550 [Candidatus Xenobia bacterium]
MPALEAASLDAEKAWPNPDWPLGVLTVQVLETRNLILSLSVLSQAQLLEDRPREAFKTALLSYRLAVPLAPGSAHSRDCRRCSPPNRSLQLEPGAARAPRAG